MHERKNTATLRRRLRVLAAAALVLTAPSSSFAANTMLYDEGRYLLGQKQDRVMLLDFHATWCPACALQLDHLMSVLGEEPYRNVWHYIIDFDTEEKLVKTFGIRKQSTLVLLKGKAELARVVGVSDKDELRIFLKKATGQK